MGGGEEVCTPVISGMDTAPILELDEHVFDAVALTIDDGITVGKVTSLPLGWDTGRDAALLEGLVHPTRLTCSPEMWPIIGRVRREGVGRR